MTVFFKKSVDEKETILKELTAFLSNTNLTQYEYTLLFQAK